MTTYKFIYRDFRVFGNDERTQVATSKNDNLTPNQVFSRLMIGLYGLENGSCKELIRYEVI